MRSIPFLLHEAYLNLRRHGLMTVAAISAIAIALSLVGAFALTVFQLRFAAEQTLSEFEIRVFLRLDTKPAEAQIVRGKITGLPGVSGVTFQSREEVWKEQTANAAIDTRGLPNLMPDTLTVRLSDPQKATGVASTIRKDARVDEVRLLETEVKSLLKIARVLRLIGLAGGIALLLGALTVVANTIRISVFARRREIKIMQIVGASAWFIRLPLVIEGLFTGLFGGAIAGATLAISVRYVGNLLLENLPQFAGYLAPVELTMVVYALVLAGAVIGAGGSFLAIRRYLKPTIT